MSKSSAAVEPVKIGFVSLGCPKNLVDSEVMMGLLARAGAEITPRAEEADVIVVNTCSFINTAQQESVNTILEMAEHKATGRVKKLVVAGCLVERFRNEIQRNIPEVDAVVGTGELESILAAAGLATAPPANGNSPFVMLPSRPEAAARAEKGRFDRDHWDGAIADLPNYLYDENTPRVLATPRWSAYIKIAEGCDHPCSFCIIPQLRGKFRSRRFESVVAEAERLARSGVREITLIGQDTTCYGEDLGLKDGLPLLLEKLADIEELCWIRFLYAYPNKISRRLLETMAGHEKICSYIDVPLQHASAAVLKRMKRGGGYEIFLRSIEKMRRTIPGLTLRTSFIVGFPGETGHDFDELCDFIRAAQFDWLGVFGYSDEDGTASRALDGKIPPGEVERRRRKLMQMQKQISRRKKKALVGRQFELLLEGPSAETDLLWEGRTEMHAPEIDGKVFVNDVGDRVEVRPGSFYDCEVTEAHDYDLVVKLIYPRLLHRSSMAKRKRVLGLRCPTCKKLVLRSDPEFPFCSERCRLIDLGKWASDGYVVSTPIFDPDELEQPGQPEHHHEEKPEGGGADSGKSHHQRR
jgi:ribosomal protein S12 methylthiotransferase